MQQNLEEKTAGQLVSRPHRGPEVRARRAPEERGARLRVRVVADPVLLREGLVDDLTKTILTCKNSWQDVANISLR